MPGISTPIRTCVRCREPAKSCCSRCDDPYCSEGCLKADWPSHRYICFKLPSLRILGEVLRDEKAVASSKANGDTTNKPSSAVAPTSNVESVPVATAPVKSEPKIEAVTKKSDPAPVAATAKTQPKVEKIEATVKTEPAPEVKVPPNKAVEPVKFQTPVESPAPATSSKFANFRRGVAKPQQKRIMFEDLEFRDLNIDGSRAKVFPIGLIDNDMANEMVLGDDSYQNEFLSIATSIEDYCKDKTPGYEPVLNEVVLCKFEGEWYRAMVDGTIDDGSYGVFYLEYCNQTIVTKNEMMKLPEELKFDVVANIFVIKNAPKLVSMLNDKQRKILEDTFMITDIEEVEGRMQCNIFGF
jgi:hypothetical protein